MGTVQLQRIPAIDGDIRPALVAEAFGRLVNDPRRPAFGMPEVGDRRGLRHRQEVD